MIIKTLQKHVFYLIGIVLFALMINLGSVFDDLMSRLNKPLFQRVILATIVLLYAYIFLIQQIYAYLFYKNSPFLKLTGFLKGTIFIMLSVGMVLSIHLLLLDILLTQRNQGTFFTLDYFKNDFLLLFIPVLLYAIFVFLKPEVVLFKFPKIDGLTTLNEEEQSTEGHVSSEKEQRAIDHEEELLALWRETKMQKFLFDYFQLLSAKEVWNLDGDIPFWKMVIIEKTAHVHFGYFLNGEKWALQSIDHTIFNNPWLVKISQNIFINMLYVLKAPDDRDLVVINREQTDEELSERSIEIITLHKKIRTALEAAVDPGRLDVLLKLSRRMKDKNYNKFWKEINIEKLDESALRALIGRIK